MKHYMTPICLKSFPFPFPLSLYHPCIASNTSLSIPKPFTPNTRAYDDCTQLPISPEPSDRTRRAQPGTPLQSALPQPSKFWYLCSEPSAILENTSSPPPSMRTPRLLISNIPLLYILCNILKVLNIWREGEGGGGVV